MPLPYNGGDHEKGGGAGGQGLPQSATSAPCPPPIAKSGGSPPKINAVNAASLHKP